MKYLPQYQHVHVFAQSCALLGPKVICEIGSFDGRDAQIMAEACPNATVIAFEANPENFFELSLSRRMQNTRVSVQHVAISDSDGMTRITVPGPPPDATDHVKHLMRGMGSMLRRPDIPDSRSYMVSKRSLDSFCGKWADENTFALWMSSTSSCIFSVPN